GETLDVRLASTPLAEVTDEAILSMLWQKTGSLYAYCGRAGAAIGLNTPDLEHPTVAALADFAGACGVGFQLQDDILGIVGDAQQLGKPVGSDIREGKRTLVITGALPNLSANQRAELDATLGNPAADDAAIARMTAMLREAGGIQHAQTVARRYVDDALQHLEPLPETPQKAHLRAWADYILARDF
ncbi:MAG: polyprenyl synthetase family protein, partial [Anaerolineales bacterium]